MKILINTPRLIPQGGVANHYIGLSKYWKEEVLYNPIGKKGNKAGSGIFRLPINIFTYIKKIIIFKPDIILLNPSLFRSAVLRDLLFLQIGLLLNKKVSIFFHGFDKKSIDKINIKKLSKYLNKCECIFVLGNEFKHIIQSWGVTTPIHLTTTKVDDKLIENFNIKNRQGEINNILFLARITKEKGIFIALEAFSLIQQKYPNLRMRVIGNGPALKDAEMFCQQRHITNVIFLGALSGEKLKDEYKNADLYLFPTFHAEGMPTSVLEAMAFGLPIISRPVGGVCDFFEQEKMGVSIDSLSPEEFANEIEIFINKEKEEIKQISIYNNQFAKKHFLASKVATSIEKTLKQYTK